METEQVFEITTGDIVWYIILGIWFLFYIIQAFLAFGTAYRCTKKGNDSGTGLFIYLIGFGFAALIPGLGLHYYIKHLPPKIQVVRQMVQPQMVKIVEQAPAQQVYMPGQQRVYTEQGQSDIQPQQPVNNGYTSGQTEYMRRQGQAFDDDKQR